ncbi:TetR/AcrR family transcriptional regulator [Amnibacterium flavum]|uniref:TetR/AcrR family transcriptional regulator n=1 Tax=Amnibacterium flavum TaxID=2173173 RepID=A0A2V1HWA2_9MICO|nr:TetR/AcrR family transcriptional regulator [Amnibacterium flavum]PVZ95390.1 TetR/AcrR family transcriptional regulator [Amnibacterium flavum]
MSQTLPPQPRMSSADRRESILRAATAVFGAKGYAGATTDDVAKAAEVSQPYVVRLFGSKQQLFLAVLERAVARLSSGFRAAIAGPDEARADRMGRAYIELVAERGLLQVISSAFLLGGDPVIGPVARRLFSGVWQLLREEAGFGPDEARDFMANGMLINTIVGLRMMNDEGDPSADELFAVCLPESADLLISSIPGTDDDW